VNVGLLIVSHSAKIAEGVAEVAAEMAPDVRIVATGGAADGGIGTDFQAILDGIGELGDTDRVVVLCDLGSAYLTVDTALDVLPVEDRTRVTVSQAPLVEGSVAAAVAAQTAESVSEVLAAADTAARPGGAAPDDAAGPDDDMVGSPAASETAGSSLSSTGGGAGTVSAEVELVNESGLHARPAAAFVTTAARFAASVTVNGVDAKSLLTIMALALPQGSVVAIDATGPDAQQAVSALVSLVESGFGE